MESGMYSMAFSLQFNCIHGQEAVTVVALVCIGSPWRTLTKLAHVRIPSPDTAETDIVYLIPQWGFLTHIPTGNMFGRYRSETEVLLALALEVSTSQWLGERHSVELPRPILQAICHNFPRSDAGLTRTSCRRTAQRYS